ncbi:MaoC family dehydratase N-terminal domain-containing protein [Rhodococcus sp. NPDC049939]|uniref:FAS1-like dehydratase domain-containing protein n=1 Tax=Rhodococcus sp. NPDC049939 TaxID=3155511 RepID=UPI0033FAE1B8
MAVNPEIVGRVYPPTRPYLVGREKIREFAKAVFANNPISFDVVSARAAGHADLVAPPTFPVIVQGRALAQLVADPTTGIKPNNLVHSAEHARSQRPVVAGDELSAVLTIVDVSPRGVNALLVADVEIVDAIGDNVSTITSNLFVRGDR